MNQQLVIKNLAGIFQKCPVEKIQIYDTNITIIIKNSCLKDVLFFFKYHILTQFKILTCISSGDYPAKKYRFKIVYELLSIRFNTRLSVKISIYELMHVDSCSSLYSSSSWYECEIWDMYGIFFKNHPNLKRIMTDYGFEGYPLRKDFPLSGFIETKYNETQKRVINEALEFSQEYRTFNFLSPWGDKAI